MADHEQAGYVLDLADSAATLPVVGGKGTSLARLTTAGLPVPSGFHVTTAAYRRVVAANDLGPRILAGLAGVDHDRPATVAEASRLIQGWLAEAAVPAEISDAVAHAYATLPGDEPVVAVRSSATAEDLPDLSFAGQQESYLNIQGLGAVLASVKCCWASLWTPRAINYRLRNNVEQGAISLAVVVQLLVPADAAGVLFTANPVNGRRDQAMISAAWGLGEAVVGGEVNPDSLTVDRSDHQVVERQTADKQVMTVRVAGGTELRPVPADLRRAPVLTDEQAGELVDLGGRIETLYEMPMDIEWTLRDGTFAIVQARPITTLPEKATPLAPAVRWEVPDNGPYLHGGAFLEVLTEPVSTLFATLGVKASDQAMFNWLERYGVGDIMVYPLATVVNGYLYGRIRYRFRPRHIPGYVGLLREHMRAIEVWRKEVERYRELAANAGRVDVSELSHAALCRHIEGLNTAAVGYWLFVGEVIRPVIAAENRFVKYYQRLARDGEDPPPQVLFRGGETLALRAERALYGLAQLAGTLPGVADVIKDAPGDALRRLKDIPAGADFLRAFEFYLDEYGYQMYSFDPLLPILAEDPRPLLLALGSYLRGGESPDDRQARMKRERKDALVCLRVRLPGFMYQRLCRLMAKAQEAARIREDSVFEMGLAWRPLRRALRELGQRLVAALVIDDAEAVFWLRWDEIVAACADLDAGEQAASLSGVAAERHATWRTWGDLQPPDVLPKGRKIPFWLKYVTPLPESAAEEGDVLSGFAASPGQVSAVARVIQAADEMERLAEGEILVARITTPAWTPIFARAAAVVTDTGGALSHSSIVAREYGIPAVTGTGSATRRIRDGDTITVDGTNGKVLLAASRGGPDGASR